MSMKFLLEFAVFICGAIVMIFELCGSRILAPYLGTSIYIWTSIIGVIMGSLSLGYYYGGKIADNNPSYKTFAKIILCSGILILISFWLKDIVPQLFQKIQKLEIASLLSSIFLFAPASFTLGIISPYAAKLKIEQIKKDKDLGKTIGNLYAISTAGSIFGTFLAGYFLMPFFGTSIIILSIGIILLILSLIINPIKKTHALVIVVFILSTIALLLIPKNKNLVLEIDSLYEKIFVIKSFDQKYQRPVLYITNNSSGIQSGMFNDNDNDLVFDYTKFYRIGRHFNPNIKKALAIGGCGYSYPKDFLKKYEESTIDVVEIDKTMTDIAKKYFNLNEENPRLKIYHEDGRTFINRNKNMYDAIYGDAFNSGSSIPYQLTTKEAVQKQYDSLNENGVVVLNIVASIDGKRSKFLQAERKTFSSIFPQVYIFPINSFSEKQVQNIMLVALKSKEIPQFSSEDPELNYYLGKLYKKEIEENIPILTDNYAPVDYYINN